MKNIFRSSFLLSVFALMSLFMFGFVQSNHAQPGTNMGGLGNTEAGPITFAIERRNRELALRGVTLISQGKKPDSRASRALLQQMNQDFKQLQVVRLAMVNDIKNGKPFEYKRLAGDAAEIRKRASRLQTSLVLVERPAGEEKTYQKVQFDKSSIQDAASDLCLEVSRFTENPMFKAGGAYSARNAADADKALNTVIALSANIKKSAETLRQSGQ